MQETCLSPQGFSIPPAWAELASLLRLPRKVAPGCQAQGRALLSSTPSLCFGGLEGTAGCRLSLLVRLSVESCFS